MFNKIRKITNDVRYFSINVPGGNTSDVASETDPHNSNETGVITELSNKNVHKVGDDLAALGRVA